MSSAACASLGLSATARSEVNALELVRVEQRHGQNAMAPGLPMRGAGRRPQFGPTQVGMGREVGYQGELQMDQLVAVQGTDFWVKVVEMLQQNWALIDEEAGSARVFFISDMSGVFDEIVFPSTSAAEQALGLNGFKRFAVNPDLQSFLRPPTAPSRRVAHPNGPIYSSGRFWRS